MKKLFVFTFLSAGVALVSCSDVKRNPGAVYMPDMAYSRAYETYAERDSAFFTEDPTHPSNKIFYNNQPVAGTVARGEEMPFLLTKDVAPDTTNYAASKLVVNPLGTLNSHDSLEASRLYLVNCGICHGTKLDGNGPLYKGGSGPFAAAPAVLVGNAKYENMPEGQMFYSATYGKGVMGSYASQLSRKQRWMVIAYIKHLQNAKKAPAAPAAGGAKADSTAKK